MSLRARVPLSSPSTPAANRRSSSRGRHRAARPSLTERPGLRRVAVGGATLGTVLGGSAVLPGLAAPASASVVAAPAATELALGTTRAAAAYQVHLVGRLATADNHPVAGQLVHVQHLVAGAWRGIGPLPTAADGSYAATLPFSRPDTVRTVYVGTAGLAGAVSPARTIAPTVATALAFGPSVQRVVRGGAATFGGRLFTTTGYGLGGHVVHLQQLVGGVWRPIGPVLTDAWGNFGFRMGVSGPAQLRAVYSGVGGFLPSVSGVASTVVSTLGEQAVALAATRAGDPYIAGAAGPNAFDCSGLTSWVYNSLGHPIPRTATAQYYAIQHVAQADKQPGDLIFFGTPAFLYHVAIYAGNGMIWHSPSPGNWVREIPIWTSDYYVGRVG